MNRQVETFRVNAELVAGSDGLRFDASYYNRAVIEATEVLKRSDMTIKPLGSLAERVFIPPRFKRIYVGESHGVPFLQGSHVVHFDPVDIKYLSRSAHVRLDRWIIRAGWVLITCSGTVGRVALAPKGWDGWAASQHILRVVPSDDKACPPGYLATFLASPLGHVQLTAQIYGAVVDELTEAQAKSVLVPVAANAEQQRTVDAINEVALRSVEQRAAAVASAQTAMATLVGMLPEPKESAEPTPSEKVATLTTNLRKVPKTEVQG